MAGLLVVVGAAVLAADVVDDGIEAALGRLSFSHLWQHLLSTPIMIALVTVPLAGLCAESMRRLEAGRRRLAEQSRLHREAEERFRDYAECSSDWLWETDAEHRFTYLSSRHEEVLAMPSAARLGRRRESLRHGDPADGDWDAHLADLEARRPFRNFRYATRDGHGRRRIVRTSGQPVFDGDGRFCGYRGVGHDITAEYEAEQALRDRERRLSKALHTARVGDWRWDLQSGRLFWSEEIYRIWGVLPESFEPDVETVMGWLAPAERARVEGLMAKVTEENRPIEYEFCGRRPDGALRHVWIEVVPEADASGPVTGLFGVCRDVTEEKRVEAALRASEERFRDFAESASDWLWEMDAEFRFSYISERVRSIAGSEPGWFIGRRRHEVVPDATDEAWQAHIRDLEARRPFRNFMYRFVRPDGIVRWFKVSGVPVFDADGRFAGYRGTGSDITDQVEAETQVRHLAHHDPLTGLPNRTLFQDRLQQALAHARRSGRQVAVLQLDLDRFKDVNDTLGHAAGDHLLREAATRLLGCVRETDTVARLGGDEFAIILTELTESTGAARVAREVVEELSRPVTYHGQTIHSGTSVGVTVFPADGENPEQLLKNADIALYEAKDGGRSAYSFFIPAMQEQIERRKRIEHELRQALARDEFVLEFQPQLRLADRALQGFEVLLRWQHPERGLISPGEFIGVAEETGITVAIGQIVVRRACTQARLWLDAGYDPGRVAVNLSMAQFRRGGLADTIRQVLRDTGLPPGYLELEITEGVLMDRHKHTVFDTLAELHRMGVTFALDDFGTGFASLSHLKQVRVDRLKIDQSFVRDIGTDPDDAAIARAVINLGHSLDLTVIAEGIETEEQLGFLRLNGCDFGQGYFFAPALSAEDAGAWMRDRAEGRGPGTHRRPSPRGQGLRVPAG